MMAAPHRGPLDIARRGDVPGGRACPMPTAGRRPRERGHDGEVDGEQLAALIVEEHLFVSRTLARSLAAMSMWVRGLFRSARRGRDTLSRSSRSLDPDPSCPYLTASLAVADGRASCPCWPWCSASRDATSPPRRRRAPRPSRLRPPPRRRPPRQRHRPLYHPGEATPASTSCRRTVKREEFYDGRWELGRLGKGGVSSAQRPRRDRMVEETRDVILSMEKMLASAPEVTLPCDEVDAFRETVKTIHSLNTELFGESTRPAGSRPAGAP